MTNELVRLAQTELLNLERQLAASPVYQRMQALRRVIELYGVSAKETLQPMPKSTVLRKISKTTLIVTAAAEYLREKGGRATSGELAKAVIGKGVQIGGKKPNATLASYLSSSALFDNVEGEGYGLKEWSATTSKRESEAPDSLPLSGASANHMEA